MRGEELTIFKDKKLKIFLKNFITYTATIKEIYEDSMVITDRYNNTILVKYEVLERIEVIQNE